jgi:hypothetical protein
MTGLLGLIVLIIYLCMTQISLSRFSYDLVQTKSAWTNATLSVIARALARPTVEAAEATMQIPRLSTRWSYQA